MRMSDWSSDVCSSDLYEALKDGWKNQNYRNWISSMENHVFPLIGRKPVDQVDSTHVVEVLTPIWLEIPDTARKILQRIGAVLDFAHIQGWREEERSEERRVGKECVSKCRSRWSPYH